MPILIHGFITRRICFLPINLDSIFSLQIITPVFGCLPLQWKTGIATVRDYNIKKKLKMRGVGGILLNFVCPLSGDAVQDQW